jgi:hypothetical protein
MRRIANSPAPYCDALQILRKPKTFGMSEHEFEEACLREMFPPPFPQMAPAAWGASTHALHPSLSRNGAFSYVLKKDSSLLSRAPVTVRY